MFPKRKQVEIDRFIFKPFSLFKNTKLVLNLFYLVLI
nr:MAG TPA: hypothetical protein [Caudoviricetes sp.]